MSGELVKAAPIMKYVDNGRIDSDVAVEDLATERERWEKGGTAADKRVAAAYAALEDGRQLVDLHQVIARGGQANGGRLPALAVAPALATQVNCRARHSGQVTYRVYKNGIWRLMRPWRLDIISNNTWDRSDEIWQDGTSTMPPMPPELRDKVRKEHLVLWEATWRDVHSRVERPPIHLDPALLEQVSGGLYRVVDTWDLTPLEAAALR